MPQYYCAYHGCSVLVRRGRCATHRIKGWYATPRWTYLRLQVLRDAAYTCAACNRVQRQLEVDHIQKHEGDPTRFWDRANLQALCPACHIAKTRRGA